MTKTDSFKKVFLFRDIVILIICFSALGEMGCYSTINITISDLAALQNQTITVITDNDIKYVLDKYSTNDSLIIIKGSGYEFKHDSRRPFDGIVEIKSIRSVSYKEYDNSKTLTFVSIYLLLGILSSAIH